MKAAQLQRVLGAPWQWTRNASSPGGRWLRALMWLALLLAPIVAAFLWLPARQAAIAAALCLSIALLALWSVQFAALLRLDHPNLARLVPGHGERLRVTALMLWALLAVLGGGVVTALLAWGGWPLARTTLSPALALAVAGGGAALLFMALALRWPLYWLLPFVVFVTGLEPLRWAAGLWPAWQGRPWLAAAVLLGVMALALVSLFGRGDAAHVIAYERRERWRRISEAGMVGQKPTLAAYGRWGEWLGAPWQRLADWWLVRATRSARPTPASAMTRAEIVLHGAQHWVRHLGALVPLQLGLVALFSVLAWRSGAQGAAQIFEHGHVGMGIGLMSMVLGAVTGLPGALWVSRREQALLMLLPGMPRGAALNRALAWRQARQFLLLWALTLPAYLAIAWMGQVPQLLVLPAVLLTAMPWLWRNAAQLREPTGLAAALPFLFCLAPAVGAIVLLRSWPEGLVPMLLGLAGLAAALLWGRWRQLSRWPQALPAGHAG